MEEGKEGKANRKRSRASKSEHEGEVTEACAFFQTPAFVTHKQEEGCDGRSYCRHIDGCKGGEECPQPSRCTRCNKTMRGCCFLTLAAAQALKKGALRFDSIQNVTNSTCLECNLLKHYKKARSSSVPTPAAQSLSSFSSSGEQVRDRYATLPFGTPDHSYTYNVFVYF
jgi:hypothetical protein